MRSSTDVDPQKAKEHGCRFVASHQRESIMWSKLSKLVSITPKIADADRISSSSWQVSRSNTRDLHRVSNSINSQNRWIEVGEILNMEPEDAICAKKLVVLTQKIVAKFGRLFPEAICIATNNITMVDRGAGGTSSFTCAANKEVAFCMITLGDRHSNWEINRSSSNGNGDSNISVSPRTAVLLRPGDTIRNPAGTRRSPTIIVRALQCPELPILLPFIGGSESSDTINLN